MTWEDKLTEDIQLLLCDAQTSGGLLLSVDPARATEMVETLKSENVLCAAQIGEMTADPECRVRVAL